MQDTPQKSELLRLINQGFPFEIEIQSEKRKPGLIGYFQKKENFIEKKQFKIKEPTLRTLDRIALASLDIDIEKYRDEENFNNYVKKNSRRHFKIMARVIAIAVAEHENQEKELTECFYKALKPSEIHQLVQMIDIAGNLTDFINSTLLVTAAQAHQAKAESVEKEELPDLKVLMEDVE